MILKTGAILREWRDEINQMRKKGKVRKGEWEIFYSKLL